MRSLIDHVKVHGNSVRLVEQTSGQTEFSSHNREIVQPLCFCGAVLRNRLKRTALRFLTVTLLPAPPVTTTYTKIRPNAS